MVDEAAVLLVGCAVVLCLVHHRGHRADPFCSKWWTVFKENGGESSLKEALKRKKKKKKLHRETTEEIARPLDSHFPRSIRPAVGIGDHLTLRVNYYTVPRASSTRASASMTAIGALNCYQCLSTVSIPMRADT